MKCINTWCNNDVIVVIWESHLVHEAYTRGFERILLWKVNPHFPHSSIIWSVLGSKKLHYKFIQTIENRHFVFRLDEFDHICVHPSLPSTWRRHFGLLKFWLTKFYFVIPSRSAIPSQPQSPEFCLRVLLTSRCVLCCVLSLGLTVPSQGQPSGQGGPLTVYNTLATHHTRAMTWIAQLFIAHSSSTKNKKWICIWNNYDDLSRIWNSIIFNLIQKRNSFLI